MFNLYLNGIKELKANVEDEIWKIFKGIESNENTPKIIKKLREDKNIFEIPLQWINAYYLLEDKDVNKTIYLFLYFDFKESELNYFLMDLNEKTKDEIAKLKTEMKEKENENILKEIENTSKNKKEKSKEKGINFLETEKDNLLKNNGLNEKEVTNNTEEELNINILNVNNNNTNNMNNNNLIINPNDNQDNFIIGLYDEISRLNQTIIDLKKTVTDLNNKDMEKNSKIQKLMKDNHIIKNKESSQNIKLRELQEKVKKLTDNYKGQLNISSQLKEKINNLEQFRMISNQKITNLEKLIFSSNLNINFRK